MIDDIVNAINPAPYCTSVFDFFFHQPDDNIVLTKGEKNIIVDQINDVTAHLNTAKRHIHDENFEDAIEEVKIAIEVSTCGKCKKKMLVAAYDIDHANGICQLDEGRCTIIKDDINSVIEDFVNNYLPRVEEVMNARES